ncbi:MAG: Crp/Fnr family transcriptional regulator, partial [Bacteroidia bacterium]|nr:Crp/Fnr family transcriptional regulator [Bacteroidia bacterium]
MKIDCSECKNENCFLKGSLSEKVLSMSKSVYKLKAGQYIFKEQNPFDGIYIILNGKVKVFSTGYKNRVQIIRLAKDGFILGHRGVGKKYYSISAVTLEDTIVCFLENDTFYEALKTDNDLTYNLMLFYAEELRNAENRMKTLAQMTVKEKVAEALLLAAKTFGTSIDSNSVIINTKLSRNDIAEIAGIRTEQFIRELTEIKKEGIVEINDSKHICINDLQFLKNMISSYYIEN